MILFSWQSKWPRTCCKTALINAIFESPKEYCMGSRGTFAVMHSFIFCRPLPILTKRRSQHVIQRHFLFRRFLIQANRKIEIFQIRTVLRWSQKAYSKSTSRQSRILPAGESSSRETRILACVRLGKVSSQFCHSGSLRSHQIKSRHYDDAPHHLSALVGFHRWLSAATTEYAVAEKSIIQD